jgi:hypothetical protein
LEWHTASEISDAVFIAYRWNFVVSRSIPGVPRGKRRSRRGAYSDRCMYHETKACVKYLR